MRHMGCRGGVPGDGIGGGRDFGAEISAVESELHADDPDVVGGGGGDGDRAGDGGAIGGRGERHGRGRGVGGGRDSARQNSKHSPNWFAAFSFKKKKGTRPPGEK